MPFHHVTAGLLYKGNYLNRSLSAGSDSEQLANISVEELDGECSWGSGGGEGSSAPPPCCPMHGRQVGRTAQQSRDTENDPDQSCVEHCGVVSVTAFVLLQLFETLSLHFMGRMRKFGLMLSQRCL